MEHDKPMHLFRNWLSKLGLIITVFSALVIIFFLILSLISESINPYIGIVVYIVLPGFLILGLLLVPLGMFVEWRRRQRTGVITYRAWPSVDMNNPGQRKTVFLFLLATVFFMLLSSVGVYQAYHYTESVQFCGLVCHTVMKPEYTAYQASPHARVRCVNCHIGPGAGWYAKSKLSGLYQVYAVLANVYPRPIPTPIENLRPAQETCETCHWPRAFFGGRQRQFVHFRYDKRNSVWPLNMLIRIGGGSPRTSTTAGIHWHMNIASRVEYIARDERRQDIPWVRATDKITGRVEVYEDTSKPLGMKEAATATRRVMDCMDCHNRPSHNYESPDYEIDFALAAGLINAGLPEIKKVSVEALAKEYASDQDAFKGIAASITDYYRLTYPDVARKKERDIDNAVLAVQAAYARNIFPFMRVRWLDYPNNIGHFLFPGCMRCHDGKHVSNSGMSIPNGCRTCHVIIAQGPKMTGEMILPAAGLEFKHPVDIGDAWKEGACHMCHKGVQP